MTPYFSANDRIGQLLGQVSDDPLLLMDDNWKINLAANMAIVKLQGQQFRKLQPPARFSEFHKETVNATNHMDKAIDLLAAGINNLDSNKLDQANHELDLATQSVDQAVKLGSAIWRGHDPIS